MSQFKKLICLFALFLASLCFASSNISVQAVGGSIVVTNTTNFIESVPGSIGSMHVIICDPNNNALTLGIPSGSSQTLSNLVSGSYKAVVFGEYLVPPGMGSGGINAVTLPNPIPDFLCDSTITPYQTQNFTIIDNQTTNVNLSGNITSYLDIPYPYDNNFWSIVPESTPGVTAVHLSSMQTYRTINDPLAWAIDGVVDIGTTICVNDQLTVSQLNVFIVPVPQGNISVNFPAYDPVSQISGCQNYNNPSVNINALPDTTYNVYKVNYQIQNKLQGYNLAINSVSVSTPGGSNNTPQRGGTVVTFNGISPVSATNLAQNSTQPIQNLPTTNTQSVITSTPSTSDSISNSSVNLANSNPETTVSTLVQTTNTSTKSFDLSLVSATELIRTGAYSQTLFSPVYILSVLILVLILVNLELNSKKS